MPRFSTNFKSDVVDFDAGTNIEADSAEELKQAITDFIQSGVIDYITRAALVAREKGHAAKRGGVQAPAPQEIPQQQVVPPAPPVPQASLPQGVEFQEGGPGGDLKLFIPFIRGISMKDLNEALRGAGARGVKKADGVGWEDFKRVPHAKRDDVVRVINTFVS